VTSKDPALTSRRQERWAINQQPNGFKLIVELGAAICAELLAITDIFLVLAYRSGKLFDPDRFECKSQQPEPHPQKNGEGWLLNAQEQKVVCFRNALASAHAKWVEVGDNRHTGSKPFFLLVSEAAVCGLALLIRSNGDTGGPLSWFPPYNDRP